MIFRDRFLVAAILLGSASACPAADATGAKLDHATVPATGKQSSLLTVDAFGRYAVTVTSSQGMALQLVDRMAGAGPVTGEAGKQDGRLDLFLDRGEHKVVALGAERGHGQATLVAHAFRELNEHPALLVENRLESASLGDFEQRSYWLEIPKQRTVALEAAGRHLADLRLWRDGTWLVDATPQIVQSQARPEQPMSVARLTADLAPGLYLLTAYGGPSQPWAEASDAKPFLLRFGIPTLAPALRQQFTMSEFGVERFVVPAGPNHFRLELPSAFAATLQVGAYSPQDPFQTQGPSDSIDKKSLPPVVELDQDENGERLVTVTMAAGKHFILQHFEEKNVYRFSVSGNYWISSIHAGPAGDSAGASAVLTRRPRNGAEEFLADEVIELDSDAPWRRRFNFLGEMTLFVKVRTASKVRVVGESASARYRFEPFLTPRSPVYQAPAWLEPVPGARPRDYQPPPWQPSNHVFELDAGLYVLTASPETRGILDLSLLPEGSKPAPSMSPVKGEVRFPSMQLDSSYSYSLYMNHQPGVAAGIVLRPLPIDLGFALPVSQRPGETLTIPVSVPEQGTLRAIVEDGRALEMTLENGKKGSSIEVAPGQYRVTVHGEDSALTYSLSLEPARLDSRNPLPPLPDARLADLPKFTVITPDAPRFLDLERHRAETYSVRVDKPGLYRFETTGLLQTGGKVRTRINPSLFAESENGVGRNFLIQRYLREGDYQLTVSVQGETKGDLGVQLSRTDEIDGGDLNEGDVARALLPAGRALAYHFRIRKQGRYHLQTLGLGRNFELRLEDDHGWPVFAPVRPGDLTEELAPGDYRVLVLPQTVDARVLTLLDRLAEVKRYEGHGPHRISLDSQVKHTWLEPAKGLARKPDQWEFVLPAATEVTVLLDNEMEASLVSAAEPERVLAKIGPKNSWRGDLIAGRYLIRAQHSRKNNFAPYTLRIAATQLTAGQSRAVSAPATIPISVGTDGLIELQSFGPSDVRARLMDATGEVIAQNDDRPGDWNFQIAQRLRPGLYRLLVEPVGEEHAQTIVSMYAPGEVVEKPLALGSDVEINDAQVHVYPLSLPADRNVLLVSARSDDTVGLALEGESVQGWQSLGTNVGKAPYLALPIGEMRFRSYRLRVWSADRRALRLSLRAVAAKLPAVPESQWLQGNLATVRADEKRPDLKLAMVTPLRPGSFRLKGDPARLSWSDSDSRTVQPGANPVISVSGKTLWLLAQDRASSSEATPMAAERLQLPSGEQESLRLELMAGQVGTIDLHSATQGPSVVIAQARTTQPGVAIGEGRDATTMGFVPGEAIAVALPGVTAPARVWNAASTAVPIELDLHQVPLLQAASQNLGFGLSNGLIKARGALPIKLPDGAIVRLTLSPMNAAVFVKGGGIVSTHWAGEEALQETVALAGADQLWLLNAGSDDAHYSMEVAPSSGETEPALKPGGLLERSVSTAGRLRVPVEVSTTGGSEYRLRVRGNAKAVWQENDGRIESGTDIAVRGSGVLWLQHQPGTLVAWLDEPQSLVKDRLGRWLESLQETTVKPPQSVSLSGKQQVLSINNERVTLLHLRTSVAAVTQFLVQGRPAQTEAHLYGANVNLLAPAGLSRVVLRAVGADRLSGVATVMATAATQLDEGVGPEVLLGPGSARLFAFDLKQPATIGIGVRASSDVVRSVLYDERGVVQSEGVVQMPTLAPGRYYLTVEMPEDTAPVRVQPILLGLKEPDTRPPFDILRKYVEAKHDEEPLIYVPPDPAPPPRTVPTEGAAPPKEDDVRAPEVEAGESANEGKP